MKPMTLLTLLLALFVLSPLTDTATAAEKEGRFAPARPRKEGALIPMETGPPTAQPKEADQPATTFVDALPAGIIVAAKCAPGYAYISPPQRRGARAFTIGPTTVVNIRGSPVL